jgi:ABC-type multidrug transport system ATPase subunit
MVFMKDVSVTIPAGEVTAVFGDGEACKSFVQCVSLRQYEGYSAGWIRYDNLVRLNGIYSDVAIVEDTSTSHFRTLSVLDYLFFAARMRLSVTHAECKERARAAAKAIGLDGFRKLETLTLGAYRLVNIAAELVGNPRLLCLVNPLEDLDAPSALAVVQALQNISRGPRMRTTVVFCTEGLHADLTNSVDNIIMFDGPRLARELHLRSYAGATREKIDATLTSASLQLHVIQAVEGKGGGSAGDTSKTRSIYRDSCKKIGNILSGSDDHVAEVIDGDDNLNSMVPGCVPELADDLLIAEMEDDLHTPPADSPLKGRKLGGGDFHANGVDFSLGTSEMTAAMNRSQGDGYVKLKDDVSGASSERSVDLPPMRERKSFWKEFSVIFIRGWRYHWKNRHQIAFLLALFLLTGALIGLFAFDSGSNDNYRSGVMTISDSGEIFPTDNAYNLTGALFAVVVLCMLGAGLVIPYLHGNIHILRAEVSAALHSPIASWLAILTVDLPIFVLIAIPVGLVVYPTLNVDRELYTFMLILMLILLMAFSLAMVCTIYLRLQKSASIAFFGISSILIFFGGFVPHVDRFPIPFSVLPVRWSFQALLIAAFKDQPFGLVYLEQFDFDTHDQDYCITAMCIWLGVLQVLVFIRFLPPMGKSKFMHNASNHAEQTGEANNMMHEKLGTFVEETKQTSLGHAGGHTGRYAEELENGRDRTSASYTKEFTQVDVPMPMRVAFGFEKLKYTEFLHADAESAVVFQGISGAVQPGQLLAIVDGNQTESRSRLLSVLAGQRSSSGTVSGTILANNKPISPDSQMYGHSAFYQQGDAMLSHLKVHEIIRLAAALRIPPSLWAMEKTDVRFSFQHTCSRWARLGCVYEPTERYDSHRFMNDPRFQKKNLLDQIVHMVMGMMNLDDVADCLVSKKPPYLYEDFEASVDAAVHCRRNKPTGDRAQRRLTAAQRRCLAIAQELVTMPSFLFLENPFRGLSWQDADTVVCALRALAAGGRSVITSIPLTSLSWHVHRQHSHTLLVSSGRMVYNGATDQMQAYFESLGFIKGRQTTVSQFVTDIAGDRDSTRANTSGRQSTVMSGADLADLYDSFNITTSQTDFLASRSNMNATNSARVFGDTFMSLDGSVAGVSVGSGMGSSMGMRMGIEGADVIDFNDIGVDESIRQMQRSMQQRKKSRISGFFDAIRDMFSQNATDYTNIGDKSVHGHHETGSDRDSEASPMTSSTSAPGIATGIVSVVGSFKTSFCQTIWIQLSDMVRLREGLLAAVVIAVIMGLSYGQLEEDQWYNKLGFLFTSYIVINILASAELYEIHEGFLVTKENRPYMSPMKVYFHDCFLGGRVYFRIVQTLLFAWIGSSVVNMAPQQSMRLSWTTVFLTLSVSANLRLGTAMVLIVQKPHTARAVYLCFLFLQALTSGFPILYPSMSAWYGWLGYIHPMGFYMSGCYQALFRNSHHLLTASGTHYNKDLENFFGYHYDCVQSLTAIVSLLGIYFILSMILVVIYDRRRHHERVPGKLRLQTVSERRVAGSRPSTSLISARERRRSDLTKGFSRTDDGMSIDSGRGTSFEIEAGGGAPSFNPIYGSSEVERTSAEKGFFQIQKSTTATPSPIVAESPFLRRSQVLSRSNGSSAHLNRGTPGQSPAGTTPGNEGSLAPSVGAVGNMDLRRGIGAVWGPNMASPVATRTFARTSKQSDEKGNYGAVQYYDSL